MPFSASLAALKWTTWRAPAACIRNSCSDHHRTSTPFCAAWSSCDSMLAMPSLKQEWTWIAMDQARTGSTSSASAEGTRTEGPVTPATAPTVASEKVPWMNRLRETDGTDEGTEPDGPDMGLPWPGRGGSCTPGDA